MAAIMGVRDRPTLDRAVDLGIAFQLTNISRDVMEDAADGRIYLPREWLRDAGAPVVAEAFPGAERELFRVVSRLLDEADRYSASAVYGIGRLPFRSAWAIAAAHRVYGAIGSQVRRRGPDAWKSRAGTSAIHKLGLLMASALTAGKAKRALAVRPPPPRTGLWTAPDPVVEITP